MNNNDPIKHLEELLEEVKNHNWTNGRTKELVITGIKLSIDRLLVASGNPMKFGKNKKNG